MPLNPGIGYEYSSPVAGLILARNTDAAAEPPNGLPGVEGKLRPEVPAT